MTRTTKQAEWWASEEAQHLYWGRPRQWPATPLVSPEEGVRYDPAEAREYVDLPTLLNGPGGISRRSPLFKTVPDQPPGEERRRHDFTKFWAWWVEAGRALAKGQGVAPKDGLAGMLPLRALYVPRRRRRQTLTAIGGNRGRT